MRPTAGETLCIFVSSTQPAGRSVAEYLKLTFSLADSSRLLNLGLLVSSRSYHQELTCLLCTSG